MRKICIVTGTRAEWGLLSPIARELKARADVQLQIIATNMHLMERYGLTVKEIEADGLEIDRRVPMDTGNGSPAEVACAMGECLSGMAKAFESLSPDMVVILGDRTEMLAVASAAVTMKIPIVHLHGGEESQGAIDNSIRHAITKLASLHLTATETYRRRVIQMGENPDNVINTGAMGVYNCINEPVLPKEELEEFLDVKLTDKSLLVTYHPATLDGQTPSSRFKELLKALDTTVHDSVIFTYPNNDANGNEIIRLIKEYAEAHPHTVAAFPSLGMRRYLSVLHYIGAVAGNSSSGIIEVPSMHIPSVNIGIRQQGRIAAKSVIHCGDSAADIAQAITFALSAQGKELALNATNPYGSRDTLNKCVTAIAETPLDNLTTKIFHDL